MIIFDEKKYGEKIVRHKQYKTKRSQGRERCVVVRYLTSLGKSEKEIKRTLSKIPMFQCEYLSPEYKDVIYSNIIGKANETPFITDVVVDIYKAELDIIMSVEEDDLRHLLFVCLVYFKWARNFRHLSWDRNHVLANDLDLSKLAGLEPLTKSERVKVFHRLFKSGYYDYVIQKSNGQFKNYFSLPFCQEEGEVAISISNYSNVLGELLILESPNEYKRCVNCGCVIKKTRSPKKYCEECAYYTNIKKTLKNRKNAKV